MRRTVLFLGLATTLLSSCDALQLQTSVRAQPFRACTPRLCAPPLPDNDSMDSASSTEPAEPPAPEQVSKVEALANILDSEFGLQVAGLSVAFLAFIAWSSSSLNDDFWLTPF